MFDKSMLSLYFIAGTQDCRHLPDTPQQNLLTTLEAALKGGISCYQFREKGAHALTDPHAIAQLAHECRTLCHAYGVPFIVNNDARLARSLHADGVHIGQTDMTADAVRAICGAGVFVRVSNSTCADIERSLSMEAQYFAVGPIFLTQSKADVATPVGVEFIRTARQMMGARPLVAIGGITTQTVGQIRQAGADGVAVISALTGTDDVMQMAIRLGGHTPSSQADRHRPDATCLITPYSVGGQRDDGV